MEELTSQATQECV